MRWYFLPASGSYRARNPTSTRTARAPRTRASLSPRASCWARARRSTGIAHTEAAWGCSRTEPGTPRGRRPHLGSSRPSKAADSRSRTPDGSRYGPALSGHQAARLDTTSRRWCGSSNLLGQAFRHHPGIGVRHRSALSGRGSAFGAAGRAVRHRQAEPVSESDAFRLTLTAISGDDPPCTDWIGPLGALDPGGPGRPPGSCFFRWLLSRRCSW